MQVIIENKEYQDLLNAKERLAMQENSKVRVGRWDKFDGRYHFVDYWYTPEEAQVEALKDLEAMTSSYQELVIKYNTCVRDLEELKEGGVWNFLNWKKKYG